MRIIEETDSEELNSTYTSGTSSISKYLTYASSHYSIESSSSDEEICNTDVSTQCLGKLS